MIKDETKNKAEHEIQRYYQQKQIDEENKKLNKSLLLEVGKDNLAVKTKTNTRKSVLDALVSFLLIFFNHN
jgi:hypothetical protein